MRAKPRGNYPGMLYQKVSPVIMTIKLKQKSEQLLKWKRKMEAAQRLKKKKVRIK